MSVNLGFAISLYFHCSTDCLKCQYFYAYFGGFCKHFDYYWKRFLLYSYLGLMEAAEGETAVPTGVNVAKRRVNCGGIEEQDVCAVGRCIRKLRP